MLTPALVLIPFSSGTASANTTPGWGDDKPGEAGGYWFAPYWRRSQGWIEVHYGKRKQGHYYWYYPGTGTTRAGAPRA